MKVLLRLWVPLLCACLLLLGGCSEMEKAPNQDLVSPRSLSEEQRQMVDLLAIEDEIMFFRFDTVNGYRYFDVWIDIYENGELAHPYYVGMSQHKDAPGQWHGDIAVRIDKAEDQHRFSFSTEEDGTGARTGITSVTYPAPITTTSAAGPISGSVPIQDSQTVVLYTALYSNGSTMLIYDEQEYAKDPDKLIGYEYAYVIQCRFSNEEPYV